MKRGWVTAVVLCAASCADEMPRDVQDATSPEPPAAASPDTVSALNDAPQIGQPPGGYVSWIEDMRAELPGILTAASQDRGDALDAAQRLYAARQQPLTDAFGEGGSAHAGDAMAEAVARADQLFRELIRQLATDEAGIDMLRETVSGLQQALTDVEVEGAAAGLPPTAPRD